MPSLITSGGLFSSTIIFCKNYWNLWKYPIAQIKHEYLLSKSIDYIKLQNND